MTTTPPPDRPGHGVPDRSANRPAGGAGSAAAATEDHGGLDLGVAQVAASALAAVTSAVAASKLGVAGTIVGAGVGAVVATVGSAVYTHSLRRAGARLRELSPRDDGRWPALRSSSEPGGAAEPVQPSATDMPGAAVPASSAAVDAAEGRRPWRRGTVIVGAGFVLALAGVTGAETVLGHPLSNSSESGTSVGRAVTGGSGGQPKPSTPTPSSSTGTSSVTSEPETSTSSTTTSSVPTATTSAPSASPSASPSLSAPSSPAQQTTAPASPEESAPATSAPVAPTTSDGG